ncbi:NAD(P)/FAD-dependent oxidoreductase [Mesorhizobium sophorae]|uniref:NAD(P)/FAD-dependent oxidoreductase n=1 Tax=Mesorhizobium sophorae TaxID=1300294 RepID=UPI000BA4545D|nr:FAD-dependent oxidoreductase [Mesorhizobium sophorae]
MRGGYAGPIHLVGEETVQPYERPPLSKAHLEPGGEVAPVPIDGQGLLQTSGIIHYPGLEGSCDRPGRDGAELILSNGLRLAYGRLVLATGASPRRLPMAEGLSGVHYLRSLADAAALRAALARGGDIAVIGAGFIGLEVAAAARAHGCSVTVIEPRDRILARGADPYISGAVARLHRARGVTILVSTGLSALRNEGALVVLSLSDGREMRVDAVIVGIGAVPNTAPAAAAGLAIDDGIAVDKALSTSDPQILAAGDCCSFPLAVYGNRRVRLESWRNARDQAVQAVAILSCASPAPPPVPWFWSDQYDHTLQVAGLVDEGKTHVCRDLGKGAFINFHLSAGGVLVAACGFGPGQYVARDIRLAEMLIARRATPEPDALASAGVKLKSMLVT